MRDDDSVLRNTEQLAYGRDAELSNMIQTKSEKEAKACSKSFGELKYITDPIVLKQFIKKEKEDHSSVLSTPKKTGVFGMPDTNRTKNVKKKKHEENEKVSDQPTQSHCNRDSLLLEENQRFELLLSALQLQISEVCRVKADQTNKKWQM